MDLTLKGINKLFLRYLVERFETLQICRFNFRYNFDDFSKNHLGGGNTQVWHRGLLPMRLCGHAVAVPLSLKSLDIGR